MQREALCRSCFSGFESVGNVCIPLVHFLDSFLLSHTKVFLALWITDVGSVVANNISNRNG